MALEQGSRLGPYEVVGVLGAGGMGEVYRARDPRLGRDVAIKVLPEELARDRDRLQRFEREARAAGSLNHPSVLAIHDVGEEAGVPYLVSELLEGQTLRERMRDGALSVGKVLELALQIAEGLAAAHAKGVVHRDLKPENLFLTSDGRLKILDFGLARVEPPPGDAADGPGAEALPTDSQVVVGTTPYMSPEQVRRLPTGPRSDVFTLGTVLYELLTRERPFRGETAPETMTAILRRDPPPPSDARPEIPPALERVVLRCLEKRAEDRYQSAHDLAVALESLAASDAARRPRAPARRGQEASPYPGLAAFGEADAENFFGRQAEVATVLGKLEQRHLLALIGPSGAGKTSFLRAGLVPALPPGWRSLTCAPGPRPFVALAEALLPALSGDADAVGALLRLDEPDIAVSLLRRWRSRHRQALLIVDPFEELFTLSEPEVQARFADLLGRLATESGVHVLLSMRDDFLFRCHAHPPLGPVFSELTPIGPPAGAELRRALVQPALQRGYRFEDDALVERMLGAVSGERGALPLLAFAAAKLWEARDDERRLLTREAYDAIGGVEGALAQHAEETLDRVGPEREGLVRDLFRNLVTAQGTRAAREREELLSVFDGSPRWSRAEAAEVLETLVGARLLTEYEPPAERPEVDASRRRVEIIHESLLGGWPRLVRWQTQDADGAQLRDQLRQAAALWDDRDRASDLLWTGTAYRDLALWRERYPGGLTSLEEAFADAAARLAGFRRRRRRVVAATLLAAATGVALVTSVLWQRAAAETRRAEASGLLALGRARLEEDPTAALAFVIASLERADTSEARRSAVEALWRGPTRIQVGGEETWSVAFSQDGRWLARSRYPWNAPPDQQLELWPRDGRPPKVFPGDGETVFAESPEGGSLMISRRMQEQRAQVLRIRTVPDGRLLRTLEFGNITLFETALGSSRLTTIALDWNGQRANRARFRSWPLGGGEAADLGELRLDEVGPWAFAEVEARARFAWADEENRIFVADAVPPAPTSRRLVGRGDGRLVALHLDPGGTSVAALEADGRLRLHAIGGETPPRILQESLGDETGGKLVFSPDGALLASERRRRVRLWDLHAPVGADPIELGSGDPGQINAVGFSPTGRWLAIGASTGTTLWPLDRRYARVLRGHESDVTSVAFDPHGRWLVSGSVDGTVRLWPLGAEPGSPSRVLFRDDESTAIGVLDVDVDPDGTHVLVGCERAGVWVVPADGGPGRHLAGFESQVRAVAFGPRGRLAAATGGAFDSSEAVIRVWDLESGETRVLDSGDGTVMGWWLQFTADGRIVSSGDSGVRLWDPETGSFETLHSTASRRPDAEDLDRFAEARGAHEICAGLPRDPGGWTCRDLDTGRSRAFDVSAHGSEARGFAMDPSGTVLVSADRAGVIRVGPAAGGPPHLLLGHEGTVMGLAVSPDGRWIASGSFDGTVRLWPMPDVGQTPLHALGYEALLDRLRALTNLRAVEDASSRGGYRVEAASFPGWATLPTW